MARSSSSEGVRLTSPCNDAGVDEGPEAKIRDLRTRYGVDFPGSFESEIHAHEVTISSFRIDPHEVTNGRVAAFVAARPEWGSDRLAADLHNGDYLDPWTSDSYPEGKETILLPSLHGMASASTDTHRGIG